MSMKFGLALPQGTLMELAGINDPVEAYETMTQVALTAEETGFDSLWLSDAFWPGDRSHFLFECWTTTAALARDTTRVRIGQLVTYSGLRHPALLAKMASTGFEPIRDSSPDQTRHFVEEEVARWTPVIKAIGLKIE